MTNGKQPAIIKAGSEGNLRGQFLTNERIQVNDMTVHELETSREYICHHTASCRGYVSRKSDGVVEEYHGRFGDGYKVLHPRWDTTTYCWVSYYIRKDKGDRHEDDSTVCG